MQRTGPGPGGLQSPASTPMPSRLPGPHQVAGSPSRCARRRPGQSSRVVGSSTWLAGPRGLCQDQPEASVLTAGGPFSTPLAFPLLVGSRAQAWRSPSRASRLCCQGSVPLGAASGLGLRLRGWQGSPLLVSVGAPAPLAAGSGPGSTLSIVYWRLGVTLSMFGAVVAAVTHRGSREGGAEMWARVSWRSPLTCCWLSTRMRG